MRTRPAERVSQTGSSASGRQVAATSTGSARKEASHNTSKPQENGDVAVVTACTASWITNAAQAQRSTAVRRTDWKKVTMRAKVKDFLLTLHSNFLSSQSCLRSSCNSSTALRPGTVSGSGVQRQLMTDLKGLLH